MPQTQKALAPELEAFIVTKGERRAGHHIAPAPCYWPRALAKG